MSGLATEYCQEIAKELDKIPVYLPGQPVAVGDVISFRHKNWLGRTLPVGTFQHVTSLGGLGVDFQVSDIAADPRNNYNFASLKTVKVSFAASGTGGGGGTAHPDVNGKLTVDFKAEGSTYFAALGCQYQYLKDVHLLGKKLFPRRKDLDWGPCFVVTSITRAERALIMQSASDSSQLTIEGEVKNLMPGGGTTPITAAANLSITNTRDASFLIPWAEAIVFFDLVRYEKTLFGGWESSITNGIRTNRLLHDETDTYSVIQLTADEVERAEQLPVKER